MSISMQGFTLLCSSLLWITTVSAALDTINAGQVLSRTQNLVSADEKFVLGFFSPENSENQYLAIWFKKPYPISAIWIANREPSLPKNSTSSLKLTSQGVLVILSYNIIIWSSNMSRSVQNPVAQLLNTGNLVVRDVNDHDPENFLWQSFDYPSDTFIPGYKMGMVRATGLNRLLTSSRTPQDPSPGNYTCGLLSTGYPQGVVWEGSVIKFRLGPWNGIRCSGTPNLRSNPFYVVDFVVNDKEVCYSYKMLNSTVLSKTVLDNQGLLQGYMWTGPAKGWIVYGTAQTDNCDAYALCGAYGSCNVVYTPLCQCLSGFVPKFPQEWDRLEWSSGCVRRIGLNCSDDVFLKYSRLKVPDTQKSWFNATMSLEECKTICKKNCSCTAFANLDVRDGGSGCLLWFGGLLDIKKSGYELEVDVYIRMAASEAGKSSQIQKDKKLVPIVVISVFTLIFILGAGVVAYVLCKKKRLNERDAGDTSTKIQEEDLELPLFDFAAIATATSNFSIENKLGEGGFGPVYKGILNDNQEIAVKRLSKTSKQGLNEFRNEVMCIAKLQHRNLVKLVGCCIEEEQMLVYEYMPNKSLDLFIFDETERKTLNWKKRFDIINGIGRGLLYLHQDSRLRIVHRDLKASNVLLDHDMNPKISDFGLARSFGGNETEANTNRVVGTYGYMSPEYAIDGIFSIKSDVFSYGVLVLEIVAGKKNRGFYHPDHYHNLLGHAWKLFKEGRSLELIDELLEGSSNVTEVSRSIHVALLCVQRSPEDRPSMPSVVLMMGSDNTLPEPKEPGFFTEREVFDAEAFSASKSDPCSNNKISQTVLCPR